MLAYRKNTSCRVIVPMACRFASRVVTILSKHGDPAHANRSASTQHDHVRDPRVLLSRSPAWRLALHGADGLLQFRRVGVLLIVAMCGVTLATGVAAASAAAPTAAAPNSRRHE